MSANLQQASAEDFSARSQGARTLLGIRADVWVIIATWVFCAAVIGITLTFDDVPPAISQGLPPETFPRGLVELIAILAAFVLYQELRRKAKKREAVRPIVFYTLLLTIGFVALSTWFDMLVAMAIYMVALGVLWGERRIHWLAIYAVGFTATVFWLFSGVMEVVFPAGPLTNLFK